MTFWSCIAAVWLAGMAEVRAVIQIRRRANGDATARWAIWLMLPYAVPASSAVAYRLEFYPEIEFLAFVGLYLTVRDDAMLARLTRFRRWLTAGLVVSVFSCLMALALFNLSGDELPQQLLYRGIVRYYSIHSHPIFIALSLATYGLPDILYQREC